MSTQRHRAGRSEDLRIGAVIATLSDEFPDLSVSKIRFLQTQGLIEPVRTPAGYRVFSAADIDRLRFVLRAQREHFWPLKVIRGALDAMDRGLTPPDADNTALPAVPAARPDPLLPTAAQIAARPRLRLNPAELLSASGLQAPTLAALQDYGLLPAAPPFDEDDLAVARAAGALAAYGVEARHLRVFRTSADREIGLVEQMRAPAIGGTSGPHGTDPTAEVLAQCVALHVALVRAGLRRT